MSSYGKHYVCKPEEYLEPKIGASGTAAWPANTVPKLFKATAEKYPNSYAMMLKRRSNPNDPLPEEFNMKWTWKEYYSDCRNFAKTLIKLNIKQFGICNILGFNAPEWFIANNGAQLAGCIAAGIYATNGPDACVYITDHSKAGVLIVEDNKQLAKYIPTIAAGGCKSLKKVVMYAEIPDQTLVTKAGASRANLFCHWPEFLALGNDIADADVDTRSDASKPGNCSTLIYTSGTTGPPKAVMISHDNITWTTRNMATYYMELNQEDRICSYLPLSHIAAQIIDLHIPLTTGACTYFCQPDALKGSLTVTLKEVRPTVFFGVPRVWEKIQEKMLQVGREITGIKKSISTWAKGLGAEKTVRAQFGGDGGSGFMFGCANSIVLSKVKDTLGLDQCKAAFTAAAPIAKSVIEYFGSLDIPLYEVFGQSECTGPHTVSYANEWKIGTCGRPMYGTESMLVKENGELCYRGRHIFMGYMYMDKQTADTIDSEGYLHSGDVAEFDADVKSIANKDKEDMVGPSGFMKITGRIKELIITAGGENIPPVLIENEMKKNMLAVSNCMVVGEKRKYLAMLVSLKCTMDMQTGAPTDTLDKDALHVGSEIGSSATTMSEASQDPLWIKYINDGMKAGNAKTTSNAQIVQKVHWLPKDFSEMEGDLTPTMKLKRGFVTKKYSALIDEIYGESVAN